MFHDAISRLVKIIPIRIEHNFNDMIVNLFKSATWFHKEYFIQRFCTTRLRTENEEHSWNFWIRTFIFVKRTPTTLLITRIAPSLMAIVLIRLEHLRTCQISNQNVFVVARYETSKQAIYRICIVSIVRDHREETRRNDNWNYRLFCLIFLFLFFFVYDRTAYLR